jgi:hypothetical protein
MNYELLKNDFPPPNFMYTCFCCFFSKTLASLLLTCQINGNSRYREWETIWTKEEPWFISRQG